MRVQGVEGDRQSSQVAIGDVAYVVLMRARERVRGALEPHLGPVQALERANNITQALVLDHAEPERVAFDMLRQLPRDARRRIAEEVLSEWNRSIAEG